MQKRIRGLVLTGVLMLFAFVAYAENISVSTFYPSPYGSYQNLDVTADTHLATTSGSVAIGAVNAGGSKLLVNGDIAIPLGSTLRSSSDWGNNFNPYDATGRMAFKTNNTDRIDILYNGKVGIGGIATPLYDLHVNGQLGLTQGGNTGDLKVAYSGGSFYAVYAP